MKKTDNQIFNTGLNSGISSEYLNQEPWRDHVNQLSVFTDLAKDMGKWSILENAKLTEFDSLIKGIEEHNKPFFPTIQNELKNLHLSSTPANLGIDTIINRINDQGKPFISSFQVELNKIPNASLRIEGLNQLDSLIKNLDLRTQIVLPNIEDQIKKTQAFALSFNSDLQNQLKAFQPVIKDNLTSTQFSNTISGLSEQSKAFTGTINQTLDKFKSTIEHNIELNSINDKFKILENQSKSFKINFDEQLNKIKPFTIDSSINNVSSLVSDFQSKNLSLASTIQDQINRLQFPLEKTISNQFESVISCISEQTRPFTPTLEATLKQNMNLNLFGKWDSVTSFIPNNLAFGQVKNLQDALGTVSLQLTDFGLNKKKWDLLQDFEEIKDQAISISDRVLEQQALTQLDIEQIKQFVQRIEIKLDEKDKDFFSIVLKWFTIISMILAIMAEARIWIPNEEAVTQTELEDFKRELQETIETKFKDTRDIRVIERSCNLRLNPATGTHVIKVLNPGTEVVIIQTSDKWVYVSLMDEVNSVPILGWVYKKYLKKM